MIGFYALKKRMTLACFNLAVGVPLAVACGFDTYRPGGPLQLVCIVLLFCLFVMAVISFVAVFVFWEEHLFGSFVPLGTIVLCIALLVLANNVGHRVRLYVFKQRLPQYEEAARMMAERIDDKPIYLRRDEVPAEYRHLGYCIGAERLERQVLAVTFWWGSAGLKISAFAYISDGKLPRKGSDFRRDWPFMCRINQNWFRVGG
jgi:hypothetical protein